MLGRELYKYRRFGQMDQLAVSYLSRLDKLRFNDEDEKDKAIRNQLRYELVSVRLFARYALARDAFEALDYARAASLLDALVDAAAKPEETQEKFGMQKEPQLARAILTIALQSNIRLDKTDRADLVLDVLDKITADEGEANATQLLKTLAAL